MSEASVFVFVFFFVVVVLFFVVVVVLFFFFTFLTLHDINFITLLILPLIHYCKCHVSLMNFPFTSFFYLL